MAEENKLQPTVEPTDTVQGGGASLEEPTTSDSQPSASTDTDQNTSAVSAEQQQLVDATAGSDRQIKTIQDWMDAEENRPESDEERKKRERREKSKKIIAAVSDGISALSNLYFTSQYAPNMYNHEKGSVSTAVSKRIDQLKADREKKRDQYMNFSLKFGDLENQRAKTLRDLEAQQEQRRLAREKAQRDAELHPFKKREQEGKANKAEQEAVTAKAEADNAQELYGAKVDTEKARRRSYDASAEASGARAGYYRSGGSIGTKKHHFRGKEYLSEKDYTKDVTEAARQYNERHADEEDFEPIIIEREERIGGRKHIIARKPEEYAGEVERRLEQEEEDNTPPSRRNNEDNTPPTRR